ncbi:hypothetical protein BDBG_01541 [Blastomyces gilchristii SLH14081]|uniref:DUF4048 domain-containing protein n=1 Tax=Blastomyces gilchristii (strain SLH14081) TaxID=559298 RepID=A0A179UCT6_BLAGS|nr:uncharacterized protein BDBG_01541 [Blastomyces gilchristii SLH14081]OAT05099.1 hypothetical protein BDBG_01541 [Blastomyces gilchristii SLH14081]
MDEASTAPAPAHQPSQPPDDGHGHSPSLETARQAKRSSLPARPNVASRHSKRLTLNFPITVSPSIGLSQTQSDQFSPASSVMSPATQNSLIPSPRRSSISTPALLLDTNNNGYDFLTALAAQERKVLELREELQKAEAELVTLKRQWALAEKDRKRIEIQHHAEPLKPLKHPEPNTPDGSNASQTDEATTVANQTHARSRELDRRHGYRNSQSSSPGDPPSPAVSAKGRTVFRGSKHTRTLSLLSGNMNNAELKHSFPQPKDVDGQTQTASSRPSRYPRSATLPSVDRSDGIKPANARCAAPATAEQKAQWRRTLPPIAQDVTAEVLMKTGRQMASDFREGLWTFIEDIRQATVGEEGINGTESRSTAHAVQSGQRGTSKRDDGSVALTRTGRSTTPRGRVTNANSTSGNDSTSKAQEISFWSEFGIDTPDQRTTKSPQDAENPSCPSRGKQQPQQGQDPEDSNLLDADENWDMWDTPSQSKASHTPSSSSSTFHSNRDHSPSTDASSPSTSSSFTNHTSPTTKDEQSADSNKTISDSIPWPALSRLHPSKLTRTASHLMAEWERSLTPPEERQQQQQQATETNGVSIRGAKED